MSLIQLYIPAEISRESIHALGKLGKVQFRDLNKNVGSFQRSFVNEIRKLDNVERQYRYFQSKMEELDINVKEFPLKEELENKVILNSSEITEYCTNAQLLEDRISNLSEAAEDLLKKQMDLKQYLEVLKISDEFFNQVQQGNTSNGSLGTESQELLENGGYHNNSDFITGVISREKIDVLQKILWRVLRGNLYIKSFEIGTKIFDPKSKQFIDKNAFIIFTHGEMLMSRIRKICESLDSDLYFVDQDPKLRFKQKIENNQRLEDLTMVLDNTKSTLDTELKVISFELNSWWNIIKLEKSVYSIMNLCYYDLNRKCLIGEGWIPKNDFNKIKSMLEMVSNQVDISTPPGTSSSTIGNSKSNSNSFPIIMNTVNTSRTPPTYHKTNKFTSAYQMMCDAYGVATYREVNPALPTAATFPFMFAIMFGDLGHGFIMFCAALFLVLNEKKFGAMKRDEIFDMAYTGRYIVLMMGAFSMYTGLLYNDVFSISMSLFKSGWSWPESWNEGDSITAHQTGVYSIGLDPTWHGTENNLLFTNSYKMKLSILMGFVHMTYSYMFSLVNALHFQSMIDIVGNFIPGLLFMQGIFGYLSICIVYKWTVDWIKIEKPAPSLLNMLISMFLSPGTVEEELYPHQAKIQVFLLMMALICVPCLLLVKPLYFKYTHGKHHYEELPTSSSGHEENGNDTDLLSSLNLQDDEKHEEHTFGDVMIHQVIHTIEFCLNCVSHTASYLRLWALSLAHAQLSSVLWSMTISGTFGMTGISGIIFTYLMFGMWFVLTVCILVVMEGTSAMLHALRLHWVEAMSKYFEGEGHPYLPYSFETILTEEQ